MPKNAKAIAEYRTKTPAELNRILSDIGKKISDLSLEIRLGKTKDVRALRVLKKDRARTYTALRDMLEKTRQI